MFAWKSFEYAANARGYRIFWWRCISDCELIKMSFLKIVLMGKGGHCQWSGLSEPIRWTEWLLWRAYEKRHKAPFRMPMKLAVKKAKK